MSEFKEKLQAFIQHYQKLNALGEEAEDGFSSEFMLLKQESQQYKESNTFPAEAGQQPFNKKKNRFKDILPYEYTRVQLHKSEGVEGSDYINANYIQGADNNVTYIAAQGPLPHTVDDFWRMLWYHQIEIVVMACKLVEMGRKKCEQYWPPVGESQMFGPIKVTMTNEESISNDFTVRELLAECQGESQVVRQYHYNAWPDHGRPSSAQPIIRMVERIGDHRKRRDIPIVVHCSAGCGRTGTIIAIDYARALLLAEDVGDELNVFSIVHEMRKQRPSMVQAKEQYVFVYVAVAEMINRILENVPRAPPKQLKFEKKDSPSAVMPSTSDGIYQNVTDMGVGGTEKRNSTGSLELSSPVKPTPPKPLGRTSSGGTPSTPSGGKPSPPAKPKPRPKPVPETPPKKPETPSKGVPEPAPRRPSAEIHPVPSPRKPSPVPPPSSTPISSSTPTTDGKGYVNIPNTGVGIVVDNETTYSVVKKSSTLPGKGSKNTSNASIFDQLMTECGDVLSDKDKLEISGSSVPTEDSTGSYSLLDTVNESDIPPEIPVMTLEASQLLVGEVTSSSTSEQQKEIGKATSIYETPDIVSTPVDSPSKPTSLAFSATLPPSSKPPQEHRRSNKMTSTGGLFKPKTKEKTRSTEDLKTTTHSSLAKTVSSGSTANNKRFSQTVPGSNRKSGGVISDKYHFPGEMGFGIRIGKPKGPRPIPSHWSIPNGLVH